MFPLQESVILHFISYRLSLSVLLRTAHTDITLLKAMDASILNKARSPLTDSRLVSLALKPRREGGDRAKNKAYPIHFKTIDDGYSSNQDRHDDSSADSLGDWFA